MALDEVTLTREVVLKQIPAGDDIRFPAGVQFAIKQALGGSVTLQNSQGIFSLAGSDLDALGAEAAALLAPGDGPETLTVDGELTEAAVLDAMRECYDPEIPVNIVDLGLIYDVSLHEGGKKVAVQMTLTARGCGMGPTIAEDARQKILRLGPVEEAEVSITWEPQWTPHMISPAGRDKLGLQ